MRGAAANLLQGLAMASAAFCAVTALAAQGGRVSPELDILSHLAPLYGAGGLAAVLIAAPVRRRGGRRTALLGFVAVAGAAALIAPEFLRPPIPAAPSDAAGQIKVIQLNGLRSNAEIGRVADWLIAQQPDVVTLNEARHDLRDLLIKRTGWKTAGAHGNLIIFTPARYLRMERPKLKATDVTFVNATYAGPLGPMEVVSAHLTWPTTATFPEQLRDVREVVVRRPQERMILTGDFNAAPWSFGLRRLEASLGVSRRDAATPTFPAKIGPWRWPLPFLSIDHVYAGPAWATVKVERGPYVGSDHYPIVVTLAPAARP